MLVRRSCVMYLHLLPIACWNVASICVILSHRMLLCLHLLLGCCHDSSPASSAAIAASTLVDLGRSVSVEGAFPSLDVDFRAADDKGVLDRALFVVCV